ncbi:MAG: hypothetical protein ABL892_03465 [Thiobacillaceae bacterium]
MKALLAIPVLPLLLISGVALAEQIAPGNGSPGQSKAVLPLAEFRLSNLLHKLYQASGI